jgi:membrane-bound lytic murein transglycosylase D
MLKRLFRGLAASLFTLSFCAVAAVPLWAQGRGAPPSNVELPAAVQQHSEEIQKIIDRSSLRWQTGEAYFKEGNYYQARRAYDEAMDVILEAGIDINSDARLRQHYRNLVEHIFQRQLALIASSSAPATIQNAPGAQENGAATSLAVDQKPKSDKRGFGEQSYEASPLDELATLKLTEDELKSATKAEAQSAADAAHLDFGFSPNALVQSFINYYLGRGRTTMEVGLRRSGRFMDMARKIFREEGVPQDLAWLAQVESAWLPMARSWAAAVGIWQFIPSTGARYGLRQDYWVDERSSFEKATRASARYLKWLADRYAGNWELAMAAYNSGEGRVDSAIARSGYADFWEIYDRGMLPQETRNYVPNILATIIIAKNPEKYGFDVKPDPPLAYDTVIVNNALDLRLAADACDASHDYLLALNPELKRGVTPPATPHPLRVPPGKGKQLEAALKRIPPDKRTAWRLQTVQSDDTFATIARRTGVSEASLAAVNGGELKPGEKVIVPANSGLRNVAAVAPKGAMSAGVAGKSSRIIAYTVKPGETISHIAARYGVSARDIAALNRITASARLRVGQVLKVPVRR